MVCSKKSLLLSLSVSIFLKIQLILNDVPFPDCRIKVEGPKGCTLKPFDAGAAHWHVLIQQKCVPISGLMLEEAHVPFATR